MTDFALQRRQRLIGIGLMCLTVAVFACLDTTAKYLGTQMDPLQVAWARYVWQAVFLVKMYACVCWGEADVVRRQLNVAPYPARPGTFRTS